MRKHEWRRLPNGENFFEMIFTLSSLMFLAAAAAATVTVARWPSDCCDSCVVETAVGSDAECSGHTKKGKRRQENHNQRQVGQWRTHWLRLSRIYISIFPHTKRVSLLMYIYCCCCCCCSCILVASASFRIMLRVGLCSSTLRLAYFAFMYASAPDYDSMASGC